MSAPVPTPCPATVFWSCATYRTPYGTTTVDPLNIVRDTGRRICLRMEVREDFGSQRGYARSWGVRPERRTFLYWVDATCRSPAAQVVREWREEFDC